MSFVPKIKLQPQIEPRPLQLASPPDWFQLLGWLLYNPFALAEYVANQGMRQSAGARWQLFSHVLAWLGVLWVLFGIGATAVVNGWNSGTLPTGSAILSGNDPVAESDILISLVLGALVAVMALVVMGHRLKLPIAASLFAFSFGTLLPILHLAQLSLLRRDSEALSVFASGANSWWFSLIFGAAIGHLLNNIVLSLRLESVTSPGINNTVINNTVINNTVINNTVINNTGSNSALENSLLENSTIETLIRWLVIFGLLVGAVLINGRYLNGNFLQGLLNLLGIGAAFLFGYARPLNWLYGFTFSDIPNDQDTVVLDTARVTFMAPATSYVMSSWLQSNWATGVKNLAQFWRYSNLHGWVAQQLLNELKRVQKGKKENKEELKNEDLAKRIVGLLAEPSWTLDELASRMYGRPWEFWNQIDFQWKQLRHSFRKKTYFLQYAAPSDEQVPMPRWQPPFTVKDDIDRMIAAMLQFQHGDSTSALDQLQKIQDKTDIVKEFTSIAEILKELDKKKFSPQLASKIKFPAKPEKPDRENTWKALDEFKTLLGDAWLFEQSKDETIRQQLHDSFYQRLTGLQRSDAPRPEQQPIVAIANRWLSEAKPWLKNPESKRPAAFKKNPYKTNNPIENKDKLFVGRKEQVKQIKDAVEAGRTVLVYGQAQIGKTSLIHEALTGAKLAIPLIRIDLRALNLPELSVGQQAFKMIGQNLQAHTGYKVSGDITDYEYFHDYLTEVCNILIERDKKIVILLDNFEEALHSAVNRENLSWLVRFLARMHFHTRNLSLIFSGRLIPSQLDAVIDRSQLPDLVQVHVSFFDKESTKMLLSKPINQASEGVLARFDDNALDRVYYYTHGHPFLVQTVAQKVLNRFNERLKNKDDFPELVFQSSDIETVCKDPNLVKELETFFGFLLTQAEQYSDYYELLLNIATLQGGLQTVDELVILFNRYVVRTSQPPIQITAQQMEVLLKPYSEMALLEKELNGERWKHTIELYSNYLRETIRMLL